MAFSSRKGKHKSSSKTGGSPIDSRQRELLEEQSKVQQRIEALQREISEKREAPQRARQAASAPAPRRTGPPRHRHSAVLADSRYDDDEALPQRNKPRTRLRREIRQAQLQMVALIIALIGAVALALHWLVG